MKVMETKLSDISSHMFNRIDSKYWKVKKTVGFEEFFVLKDAFELVKGSVQTSNYVSEKTEIPYIRVGDIDSKYGININECVFLDEDTVISENKTLQTNDLVLAVIGSVGKIGRANLAVGGTHSNNTVVLRPKKEQFDTSFYEKLFQTDYFNNYFLGVASQKEQPNLQQYEIDNIMVPIVPKNIQEKCLNDIKEYESQIATIKKKIKPIKVIIDEVLKRELEIDFASMKKIDEKKDISVNLNELLIRNANIRNSYRWNKAILIQNCLLSSYPDCIKLGKVIDNTKNGWSPSCSDDGNYQVLGIDSIQPNGQLLFDNVKYSSVQKTNLEDFYICNGDFFVVRGNTTDLVAMASLVNEDEEISPTIFSDLMIRIRFSKDVDPQYMAYIFNSFIGRMYFKYSSKGKNQTMVKVSKYELNEFIVPLPSINIQKRIVKKIEKEIIKQKTLKDEMDAVRANVDKLVTKTFIS